MKAGDWRAGGDYTVRATPHRESGYNNLKSSEIGQKIQVDY